MSPRDGSALQSRDMVKHGMAFLCWFIVALAWGQLVSGFKKSALGYSFSKSTEQAVKARVKRPGVKKAFS